MSVELKIKSKHLALEPAIIRKEEQKFTKQIKWYKQKHQLSPSVSVWESEMHKNHPELQKLHSRRWNLEHHRKTVVRFEARATHLARAYIAGIPYEKVESKRHEDHTFIFVILPRVYSMVAKYGNKPITKKWNREKNMLMFDEAQWKELTDFVNAWCNI
jgi:hypothetical protein